MHKSWNYVQLTVKNEFLLFDDKTFSKAFRSFVSDCKTNMKLPSLTHVLVDAYDDTWRLFMIALHLAHGKSPFVPFNHVKVKTLNFCLTICLLITNN